MCNLLQVRNVILRALQQSQVDKAAAAAKTHEAAAKAAQVAVERVFEHCLQVRLDSITSSRHEPLTVCAQPVCWILWDGLRCGLVLGMSQSLHSLVKLLGVLFPACREKLPSL